MATATKRLRGPHSPRTPEQRWEAMMDALAGLTGILDIALEEMPPSKVRTRARAERRRILARTARALGCDVKLLERT